MWRHFLEVCATQKRKVCTQRGHTRGIPFPEWKGIEWCTGRGRPGGSPSSERRGGTWKGVACLNATGELYSRPRRSHISPRNSTIMIDSACSKSLQQKRRGVVHHADAGRYGGRLKNVIACDRITQRHVNLYGRGPRLEDIPYMLTASFKRSINSLCTSPTNPRLDIKNIYEKAL